MKIADVLGVWNIMVVTVGTLLSIQYFNYYPFFEILTIGLIGSIILITIELHRINKQLDNIKGDE